MGTLKIISWSLCYPRLGNRKKKSTFYAKTSKMNCAFTSLGGLLLIAQAGFFICCTTIVGLFLRIIILLKFHVPSRDLFLQSFAKLHCL